MSNRAGDREDVGSNQGTDGTGEVESRRGKCMVDLKNMLSLTLW